MKKHIDDPINLVNTHMTTLKEYVNQNVTDNDDKTFLMSMINQTQVDLNKNFKQLTDRLEFMYGLNNNLWKQKADNFRASGGISLAQILDEA